jgi:hypothetical protein
MEFRVAFVARSEFGSFALRSLDSFAPFSIRTPRALSSPSSSSSTIEVRLRPERRERRSTAAITRT